MPVVKCAFYSPDRSQFILDNTIKTIDLVKLEVPQCPLILMDGRKSIYFPEEVNTNATIAFDLKYQTSETNFELLYGAFFVTHGRLVPFPQFLWRQDISRGGQRAHIRETAQVNVPSQTIWQIGFRVSPNVADSITSETIMLTFEPWNSLPGKPA